MTIALGVVLSVVALVSAAVVIGMFVWAAKKDGAVISPLLVLRHRLLPQFVGVGRFLGRQRARRRPVPTGQAVEEGAQALHEERA